jgi:integrase
MDKTSETWLNTLSESTRKVYRFYWKKFLKFTNMSAEQILEDKRKEGNGKWKTKVFEFKEYLKATPTKHHPKGMSEYSVNTAIGTVRGFFSYYETPVRFTRGEKQRLKKAKRKRRDYKFSKSDLRKMAMVSNLKEKYIVLVGKSLGLRASDFIKLTYGDYRALDLTQEAPIPLGELDTRKEGVSASPFLDSDSVPIIKQLLESNQDKTDNERVLDIRKTELTVILQRLAERANIESGNQHVRFHGLRKYLTDRLSAYTSESQWKQIVGKTVSESEYISTQQLKPIYSRAMKDIIAVPSYNNTESLKTTIEELRKENEALRNQLKGFRILFEEEIERKLEEKSRKHELEEIKPRKAYATEDRYREELERIGKSS